MKAREYNSKIIDDIMKEIPPEKFAETERQMMQEIEDYNHRVIIQKLLDIEKNSSNVIIVLLAKIKRVRELKKWYELKYNEK